MSLLSPESPSRISREDLVQRLENQVYGPEFKRLVLDKYDSDHATGTPWASVMLTPQLDSEENGEIVPYQVCIVAFQDGPLVGFCVNEPKKLGRAMPMLECFELWPRLLIEQEKRNKAKEGSSV